MHHLFRISLITDGNPRSQLICYKQFLLQILLLHLGFFRFCFLQQSVHLTIHYGQCDAQLTGVVGDHDEDLSAADTEAEAIESDERVGDDEGDGAQAAAHTGPRPHVVVEPNSRDSSP